MEIPRKSGVGQVGFQGPFDGRSGLGPIASPRLLLACDSTVADSLLLMTLNQTDKSAYLHSPSESSHQYIPQQPGHLPSQSFKI